MKAWSPRRGNLRLCDRRGFHEYGVHPFPARRAGTCVHCKGAYAIKDAITRIHRPLMVYAHAECEVRRRKDGYVATGRGGPQLHKCAFDRSENTPRPVRRIL
jgi:hypothetical protein